MTAPPKRGRGRPKKAASEQAAVTTSFRLYPADLDRLDRLAEYVGEFPSETLRRALELAERHLDEL